MVKYLPTPAELGRYCYVDTEGDSLTPSVFWMMCASRMDTDEVTSLVGHDAIVQFFKDQPADTIYIGHNAISFDAPQLRRVLGVDIGLHNTVDTLVLGYLYNPALQGGHSLAAWGERMGDPKGDFHDFSKYSADMDKYCQQDVRLGKKVFKALVQRMLKMGFSELSCEIEHQIREVIDEQQANGWYFDIAGAQTLVSELRAKQADLEPAIHELFPRRLVPVGTYTRRVKKGGGDFATFERHQSTFPKLENNSDGTYTVFDWEDFNIGSPKQRVARLLELGYEPVSFTKPTDRFPEGQPKVDEESLMAFAEQSGHAAVQAIAEWLVLQGRATMVEGWLNCVNYDDHRMHGRVMTCAATTRRMIHNTPNTANIPKAKEKVPYGIRCRQLWQASPGRVEGGGDASGLEMRMFAEYLGTQEAIDLFTTGDPHLLNTRNLGLPDEMRNITVKNGFYAYLYGAGDPKLGKTIKPELQGREAAEYGKWARGVLEKGTPGLARLVADITDEFNHNGGILRTIDGGFVRCTSKSAALNYKLQSAGAIVMKRAAIIARNDFKMAGLNPWLIGTIHDENQYDILPEEAEEVGRLYVDAIRKAGVELGFKCPLTGDFKLGANWSECH